MPCVKPTVNKALPLDYTPRSPSLKSPVSLLVNRPTFPIFKREAQMGGRHEVPADLDIARKLFHANCGPASFAALVGTLITDIIRFFPHFPHSPHTSIPHMRWALDKCGVAYKSTDQWPRLGLALIQFIGPWSDRGRFHAEAQHRHWVAVSNGHVYDVNAHSWLPLDQWRAIVMPLLIEAHPAATSWSLAKSYEVIPSLRYLPEFPQISQNAPSRSRCAHCD